MIVVIIGSKAVEQNHSQSFNEEFHFRKFGNFMINTIQQSTKWIIHGIEDDKHFQATIYLYTNRFCLRISSCLFWNLHLFFDLIYMFKPNTVFQIL